MSKLTGIARIKVGGQLLQTDPGSRIALGGFTRTPRSGHTLYGYNEAYQHAEVECTIRHGSAVDVEALRNATNVVIRFETDAGPVYQISDAFLTAPPELVDGEGTMSFTFAGSAAIQVS